MNHDPLQHRARLRDQADADALAARDPVFAQAYALMGLPGLCFAADRGGMILAGDWDQDVVRARLCPAVDDLTWFEIGIHLQAAGLLKWCVGAAPDTTTDAWRDEVWDGYWAEASITAAGVLSLAERTRNDH